MTVNVYKIKQNIISSGNAVEIPVSFVPSRIVLQNRTRMASLPSTVSVVQAFWDDIDPANTTTLSAGSSATSLALGNLTSGGIFVRSGSEERYGNPIAYTGGTAANPVVITSNSHGVSVGQRIKITSSSTAKQVEQMEFTVTATTTNTLTLGYLNGSGFAAALGTGNFIVINYEDPVLPASNFVTAVNVTNRRRPVVTFGATISNYSIGQQLSFDGFDEFGMTQMNDQTGVVTAINTTTNTVTLDLNTTGFTAFAFPASASAGGQRPLAYPKGQVNTFSFDSSFTRNATPSIMLGSSVVGSANDNLSVVAEYIAITGS